LDQIDAQKNVNQQLSPATPRLQVQLTLHSKIFYRLTESPFQATVTFFNQEDKSVTVCRSPDFEIQPARRNSGVLQPVLFRHVEPKKQSREEQTDSRTLQSFRPKIGNLVAIPANGSWQYSAVLNTDFALRVGRSGWGSVYWEMQVGETYILESKDHLELIWWAYGEADEVFEQACKDLEPGSGNYPSYCARGDQR
jgi:hypothetical protein